MVFLSVSVTPWLGIGFLKPSFEKQVVTLLGVVEIRYR